MELIAAHEGNDERGDRSYWLKLYTQCYKAANGNLLKHVMDTTE
jgi:hypothetical protein